MRRTQPIAQPAKSKSLRRTGAAVTASAFAIAAISAGSIASAPVASAATSCGLNVGVVLDATWSFTDDELAAEKAQAAKFVNDLSGGPGILVSGSQFGYTAPLWGNGDPAVPLSVDENATLPGNATFHDIDVSTSAGAQDAASKFLAFTRDQAGNGTAASRTNWEAGLRSMQGSGVNKVVFVTDGVPNAWGSTTADLGANSDVTLQQQALDAAAAAIADLRAEGIEVIPLFVKSSAPGLHGMNDPLPGSPTPTADIERAMQVLDPSFTIDKALSIDAIAEKMLADVTATCTPGMTLDKSHDYEDTNANGRADAGDTLKYKFLITNTGQTPLNSIDLQDQKLTSAGVTWAFPTGFSGTLAPGESVLATSAPYVATSDDEAAGSIDNTATVTAINPWDPANNPPEQTDTDTQTLEGTPPSIDLEKTVKEVTDVNNNGIKDAGDQVIFGFKGTNTGAIEVTDVELSDPLLDAVKPEPVAVTPDTSFDGTLAPGESVTWTSGGYTLTQNDVDMGMIHNQADLTGIGTDSNKTPVYDTAGVNVMPDQKPAIDLEKTVNSIVDANGNKVTDKGDKIVYGFKGTNVGSISLTDVTLTDEMLSKVSPEPVAVTASTDFDGRLAPGASTTWVSGEYTLTQADIDKGLVHNSADITGVGVDKMHTPVKDTAEVDVTPEQAPAIELKKIQHLADTNGDGDADAGEQIGYEFVATNTGNITLHDVNLADQKLVDAKVDVTAPEGFTKTLAPGESVTFASGAYTVTTDEADAGTVDNTATVTATPEVGSDVSDDDTVKMPSRPDAEQPVAPIVEQPTVPTVEQPATPAKVDAGYAPANTSTTDTTLLAGIGAGILALLGAAFGIRAWRKPQQDAADDSAQ
ncbi:hypothetical protein ANMWB30_22940 [Arthrobacter sp. MWB30]|nr:hypothetical protein ANMWB30_22940 [Arthrobacter sp. MWB30]